MDSYSQKSINIHKKLCEHNEHGSIQNLGWGSVESQQIRFQIFGEIGSLENKTILDIGCGYGDFYDFLFGFNIKSYVGVEEFDAFYTEAVNRHKDVEFINKSFYDCRFEKNSFDYVFASGLFGWKSKDWAMRTSIFIQNAFNIAKIGFGVNFLSDAVSGNNPDAKYTNPKEILPIVERLTRKYKLIHDYKDNDFTIFMYRS